jgi:hypothetical protein
MPSPGFIIVSIIVSSVLSAGCSQTQVSSNVNRSSLDSTEGLGEYLLSHPSVRNVRPWSNEYAPALTITTDHYEIHTTLLDPLIVRQIPTFMETAYGAYQQQLLKPIETRTIFTIYLFSERSQWERFTRTFAAPNADVYLSIARGAYCLKGACVAYDIGRDRTLAALGHEGWHQFNSRHFAFRLPSWLDEGIATVFETAQYEGDTFRFLYDTNLRRLNSLKKAVDRGQMVPLERFVELNPAQLIGSTDAANTFYAQAYALIRFLKEDDYGGRLAGYQDMLLGGLNGTWPLDEDLKKTAADRNIGLTSGFNIRISPGLFARYIGTDMDRINSEYLDYCRRIVHDIPSESQQ